MLGAAVEESVQWGGHPIEVEECEKCGGNVSVIGCIEEPAIIERILEHLGLDRATGLHNRSPPTHHQGLFDQAITLI